MWQRQRKENNNLYADREIDKKWWWFLMANRKKKGINLIGVHCFGVQSAHTRCRDCKWFLITNSRLNNWLQYLYCSWWTTFYLNLIPAMTKVSSILCGVHRVSHIVYCELCGGYRYRATTIIIAHLLICHRRRRRRFSQMISRVDYFVTIYYLVKISSITMQKCGSNSSNFFLRLERIVYFVGGM